MKTIKKLFTGEMLLATILFGTLILGYIQEGQGLTFIQWLLN